MRIQTIWLLTLLGLLPASGIARADTVELNGGTKLDGVVLSERKPDGPSAVSLLLRSGQTIRIEPGDVKAVTLDPEGPKPGKYLRFTEPSDDDAGGLDVAVTSFVPEDGGPRVDLVSAVHIADGKYFREVQKLLESAELVLYEGVKKADATPEDFQKETPEGENPIRDLQTKLAEWFGLAFQLEEIDYSRPHFVHADMTAEELAAESPGLLPAGPEGGNGEAPSGPSDDEAEPGNGLVPGAGGMDLGKMIEQLGPMLGAMMSSPQMRRQFKTQFARIMGTADVGGLLGTMMPDLADVLLHKRNDVVIDRVKTWAPKTEGSIAVFYGAAHMADLEKALVEAGYRRAGGRWLRAWHLDD